MVSNIWLVHVFSSKHLQSVFSLIIRNNRGSEIDIKHAYLSILTQIRENSKFSSTQRTELEKFYKGLRKDLGLNEIENPEVIKAQNIAAEESAGESIGGGEIMDNRKLNDLIKNAMISKEKDK